MKNNKVLKVKLMKTQNDVSEIIEKLIKIKEKELILINKIRLIIFNLLE